ncbi:hypothetical protein [Treponema brennaborense]|uniref:Transglutaminase domain-containing protein n=1 Tax=Treponema brennaborense (strain DSM 12168 / CIP 105900 / DD5/3) TaxID=906968 RepID=F4LQ58_TREBD|nr:hypothetical protein [Treponema brennaborense]AEE17136.1 hypothetical protein Trebr_1714 [Treponema brennaborense DSM 12168]
MKKHFLRYIIAFILAAAAPCGAYAELLYSPTYGYSIDLPEAFALSDATQDGTGYLFDHTIVQVQVTLRIYPAAAYDNANQTLSAVFKKLSAQGEITPVSWRNADCVLAKFTMRLSPQKTSAGWAVCAALPESKGYLTLLAYAEDEAAYEQFILSVVDSIYIDRGSYYECGPVTAFAFPGSSPQEITMTVEGTPIRAVIDAEDAEANKFVIDREYGVLSLYADSEYRFEARDRYYRQIYRDAYKRLKKPAFALYAALSENAARQNQAQPEAALAQTLLSWVQTFPYDRDFAGSDFSPLPAVLAGSTSSDCDSRALLLAVLLRHMNYDTVMFVSDAYRHAVLGIALDLPGAKITVGERPYLLAETTAPVSLGLIAQDMAQTEQWRPVTFDRY